MNKRLISATLIYTILFVITRVAFYNILDFVGIVADTTNYTNVAPRILRGLLPSFPVITPGYPLFLFTCFLINGNIWTVVIFQIIISYIAGIFFIYAVNRTYSFYSIAAAAAMIVAQTSLIYTNHEASIQSEHLFINFLIFSVTWLLLALYFNKKIYWIAAGTAIILSVYIRPSGLFMVPIIMLIIAYMWANKFSVKTYISFLAPVVFFYLLLCSYNYITLKKFSISPLIGVSTSLGTVITYIEPDPSYPAYLNNAIEKTIAMMTPQEREIVQKSWKLEQLQNVFIRYHDQLNNKFNKELEESSKYANTVSDKTDINYRNLDVIPDLQKVKKDALKKHFSYYMKFVLSMGYQYFTSLNEKYSITYPYLQNWKDLVNVRVKGIFYSQENKAGRVDLFKISALSPEKAGTILSGKSSWYKLEKNYFHFHSLIFQNLFWVFASFIILIIAGIKLIREKLHNPATLFVSIIVLMNIFNAILICLVQMGMIRYASTLHFTYYMALALSPLILPDGIKNRIKNLFQSRPAEIKSVPVHRDVRHKKPVSNIRHKRK